MKGYFIYDGDCAFCQKTTEKISGLNPTFNIVTSQSSGRLFLEYDIDPKISEKVAVWISADGDVRLGPRAISAALKEGKLARKYLGILLDLRILEGLTQYVYRKIAERRKLIWWQKDSCTNIKIVESDNQTLNSDRIIGVYVFIQFALPATLFLLRCPPINKTLLYGWGWQMFS
jgi:hypothetical protein